MLSMGGALLSLGSERVYSMSRTPHNVRLTHVPIRCTILTEEGRNMPIYEYVCPSCETKFELLRPFSRSSEDAPCPKCQSVAKRVLSVFACFARDAEGVST